MNDVCPKFVFASFVGIAPTALVWALISFTMWQPFPVWEWPIPARFLAAMAYAILGGITLYALKDE